LKCRESKQFDVRRILGDAEGFNHSVMRYALRVTVPPNAAIVLLRSRARRHFRSKKEENCSFSVYSRSDVPPRTDLSRTAALYFTPAVALNTAV
jgi:hypothetical protein